MVEQLLQKVRDALYYAFALDRSLAQSIGQFRNGIEIEGADGKRYYIKVEIVEVDPSKTTHGRIG